MAHRQVETTSIHSSTYHTGWIRIDDSVGKNSKWQVVAHNKTDQDDSAQQDNVLPCTHLDLATQIHMPGTERLKLYPKPFRWAKDVNFHENLRLPSSRVSPEKGLLAQFEAMASEGVAVAISPKPGFVKGATIEFTFGAIGNTKTTIQWKQRENSVHEVSVPCRVCQEGTWISFWVGVWKGRAYAGVGNSPGQQCLTFLDISYSNKIDKNNTNDNGNNAEASQDVKNDETGAVADVQKSESISIPPELLYVGFGNAAQQKRFVKLRNIHVLPVPSVVATNLENIDVLMDQQDEIDDDALKEYQAQCRKAKARAEKFGIEYKEPDLASVVPWSQARKLRANPQKGFITGIDVTDPKELEKQEARKSRFGINSKKRELEQAENESKGTDDKLEEDEEKNDCTTNVMAEGESPLPVIQAWDNEELVRFQRVDPPSSLWKNPPEGAEAESEPTDEFSMETDKPTLIPEKLHVFSPDWSAFKQIRSEDLMAYFTIYGPSYVEWLGDLSCNILFEDKFSAVRAMQAMAQDVPSPPPSSLTEDDDEYVPPDFGAMGWKLGRKLVRKTKNDRFGRRGTTARVLMRPATSLDILEVRPSEWPDPPPGFSTKRVLGPGSDYFTSNADADDENEDDQNNINLGRRRKRRRRNSDRDKTAHRNSKNDKNVQAQNHGNQKRKKSTGKRRQSGSSSIKPTQLSASDMLNQGLSSSRAGFSVEEMEALRASKKNATSK